MGATSGIGMEIAKLCIAAGWRVGIAGRRAGGAARETPHVCFVSGRGGLYRYYTRIFCDRVDTLG